MNNKRHGHFRFGLFIISLTLGTSFLFSQQADSLYIVPGSVKAESGELVGRFDRNGNKAVGLIIYSDLNDLRYKPNNGLVDSVDKSKPGRDFIFLSSDERVVEVYMSGYLPLKIILSEYGIQFKRSVVWSLQITGNKKKKFGTGFLSVCTDPPGAEFLYELGKNNWVTKMPPFDTIALPTNVYPVRVQKEFYRTVEDTIDLETNARVSKKYSLERLKGFLLVKARDENNQEISGATIFLNGMKIPEKTPYSKRVNADRYTIRIEMEGFLVDSATVVLRDEEHPESKEFVLRRIGIVTFKGPPQSSVSYLDDLGNEKTVGAIPANGAFVTQLRPREYSMIYRLGRPVRKYSDIDVSDYNGELYDVVHTSLSVPSDRLTAEYSIEQTNGRFFRFNALGNDRIAHLTDGIEFNTGFVPMELTPSLLSTALGFPIKDPLKVNFSAVHLIVDYNPFSFSINGYSSEVSQPLSDTMTYNFDHVSFVETELLWMPAAFWEKVFPFIGGCYINGRFQGTVNYGGYSLAVAGYGVTNDEETQYSTPGIVVGALVRLPVLSMFNLTKNEGYLPDLVLRVKYRHLLDTKAYQSQFSAQFGIAMRLPFLAGF